MEIKKFDIYSESDEIWNKFFNLSESVLKEIDPHEPIASREFRKSFIRARDKDPNYNNYRYLVFDNNKENENNIIAYGRVETKSEKSKTFRENFNIGQTDLIVDKDHRRKSVGTKLIKHIANDLKTLETSLTDLSISTSSEISKNFLEKLGGVFSNQTIEYRLYLDSVNWDLMENWVKEGEKNSEGTQFEFVNSISEKDMDEYCRIYSAILNKGMKTYSHDNKEKLLITPEKVKFSEETIEKNELKWVTLLAREKNNTIGGFTEILYHPKTEHRIVQMLTGVLPEYRGRGVGKALKAGMLLHIKKSFPKVKYVSSVATNLEKKIVDINNKMGFKKHKTVRVYSLKLSKLI
jgi:mycothiol synthase